MPDMVDRDEMCVSHEDDALRHYLDDATALLDDTEVLTVPVDRSEPDEMEWKRITRRAPRAVPYPRRQP